MRVVVNQMVALGPRTGIGHYTAELVRCMRQQAAGDRIDTFPEGALRKVREFAGRSKRGGPPEKKKEQADGGRSRPSFLKSRFLEWMRQSDRFIMARFLQLQCYRHGYDLYHEPNYIPLPIDRPTISTLHDLSIILHPQWHPADRVAYYEKYLRPGVKNCIHFLTDSDAARMEIIRALGVAPERVTRTYMGVRSGLGPLPRESVVAELRRLDLPEQYLLHVGTIEPRKNILQLLRAYCDLPSATRERWPLLLVGRWGWNSGDVTNYYHDTARHQGVRQVGYVPEHSLSVLYNGARALVFPTFYEGFGMPPIEMMACGGAVIASTADAVREVVGDRAFLIDPMDTAGWRDAMLRIATDDDWHRSLRKGVTEVAARYTWEQCAAETLQVYRRVCQHGTIPAKAARPGTNHPLSTD